MEYRILLLTCVVLALYESVHSAPCPAVFTCIQNFAQAVQGVGHDEGAYCRTEKILLECLHGASCPGEMAADKEGEIRHFEHDGKCDSASALYSGIVIPICFVIITKVTSFISDP